MIFDKNYMLAEMHLLKAPVLNNCRILAPYNADDYYYEEILKFAADSYFFETYQVIVWAGARLQPKVIMEIGSRNGGSLIQLLSMYSSYDHLDVTCFDLWREIGSPEAIKRNLGLLNIPSTPITFITGDSRRTIPTYRQANPEKKFDYILVDGGHEQEIARCDLSHAFEMVASGGIIIFDDITPLSYNLKGVWDQFRNQYSHQFMFYESTWRKGVAWAIKQYQYVGK
jgi:predicted O-methyltransferase YrrM